MTGWLRFTGSRISKESLNCYCSKFYLTLTGHNTNLAAKEFKHLSIRCLSRASHKRRVVFLHSQAKRKNTQTMQHILCWPVPMSYIICGTKADSFIIVIDRLSPSHTKTRGVGGSHWRLEPDREIKISYKSNVTHKTCVTCNTYKIWIWCVYTEL